MNSTKDFSIRSAKGGYDDNFSYLITCLQTGFQCIIDPALPYDTFKPFIRNGLSAIFITHTHGDHISFLNEYLQMSPKTIVIAHHLGQKIVTSNQTHFVHGNENIKMGQLTFKIIFTPGHYPDSICLQLENVLFTGDTLFVGRTGRVISAGSNIQDLFQSVYQHILTLPPDTLIYPGHDYGNQPTITLEENILISSLLQAESEQDFILQMAQYENNRSNGS